MSMGHEGLKAGIRRAIRFCNGEHSVGMVELKLKEELKRLEKMEDEYYGVEE